MSLTTKIIAGLFLCAVFALSAFAVFQSQKPKEVVPPPNEPLAKNVPHDMRTLGISVESRPIDVYTFGNGPVHLAFVGGIHGGYEWNSVALAQQLVEYLKGNPDFVPANFTIDIIPDANPDGVYKALGVTGSIDPATIPQGKDLSVGRFNADGVDLNRNFDCKWSPKGVWKGKSVSTGSEAFSEPESKIIRDFMTSFKPNAAIFWHSQADGVYASQCNDGILPATLDIMNTYATAAGYPAIKTFDAYAVTGASEDWLASIGIPAITVELKTHDTVEWDQNLAGVKALIAYFAQK